MTRPRANGSSARTWLSGLLIAGAIGCASEGPEVVLRELVQLEHEAADGVAKVRHSLRDPSLTFDALGDGVRTVELAARNLVGLQHDPRASESQRVRAVVSEARAFDDVALAFAQVEPPADLAPDQRALMLDILKDKGLPARASAEDAFRRGLEMLCEFGLVDHPNLLEILDGIGRYGGQPPPSQAPCGD